MAPTHPRTYWFFATTFLPFLLSACSQSYCIPRPEDDDSGSVYGSATGTSNSTSISSGTTTGTTTGAMGTTTGTTTTGMVAGSLSAAGADAAAAAIPLTIEEADLVKRDGDTLFVHNAERGLQLVDISNPLALSVEATVPEVAGDAGEVYVHADHALVLLGEQNNSCTLTDELQDWTLTERHALASVALHDDYPVASTLCLPGHLVASRLIGDYLFTISALEQGDALLSWVIGIDVTDPSVPQIVSHSVMSGIVEEVHVTEKAVYLVQGVDALGEPASAEQAWQTQIRYIDIDQTGSSPAGTVTQRGSITIAGAPQGRFHLDEYGDTFRIVTFASRAAGSYLYVVDTQDPDSLSIKGHLPNIAPGEDLHATRFDGETVYIVTYEAIILRTDPLWVVSLADPQSPEILGHLEVPGFSSYVFPRGDQLLAVGRGDEGRRVAASLFDISDPTRPVELTRIEFGSDATFTEGNLDFRGVTVIEEPADGGDPLLVLPTTFQTMLGDEVSCEQENALTLIDIHPSYLSERGTAALTSRVQRTLPEDEYLMAIGRGYVGTLSVADRDAPEPLGGVWFGDPEAPVECIPFQDIYGNSTDAVTNNTNQGNTMWDDTMWTDSDFRGDDPSVSGTGGVTSSPMLPYCD